ncbi:phage tail domain-containing protein [Enterococcus thailandicus]|uniref:phage tail domain-containing protein n=1 Tax=Enterococcus thailandicus TaxID=417368 RepID=UPI00288CD427|nr:phage tail domain-containing protein [Enterococcus thailandicus]MDT2752345.1 phage tail family protein [Enterococcus thailandicus]MDT2776840.1 phage tail family protein [Enterococcus thailandicus]
MISFYDGQQTKRVEDFGFYPMKSHKKPRSGQFEMKQQHIAGRSGDWYFGTEIKSKSYSLDLLAWERDWSKFESMADELNSFFLDAEGKPKLLKVTWENSKRFLFLRLASEITPNVDSVIEKITLNFIAYDPHEYAEATAYDPEEPLKYDVGNPYGSKSYPNTQSFKWIYSRHYSSIENYSSLNTDVKITIKGIVINGSITHMNSGKKIKIPDISNGTIVVDTEIFNLSLNGKDTIIDGDFFKLSPGANSFLFEADSVNASVIFDWYHKFS